MSVAMLALMERKYRNGADICILETGYNQVLGTPHRLSQPSHYKVLRREDALRKACPGFDRSAQSP